MKTRFTPLLSLFTFSLLTLGLSAQTINVHLTDGRTLQYNSAEVSYVDFSEQTEDPDTLVQPTPAFAPGVFLTADGKTKAYLQTMTTTESYWQSTMTFAYDNGLMNKAYVSEGSSSQTFTSNIDITYSPFVVSSVDNRGTTDKYTDFSFNDNGYVTGYTRYLHKVKDASSEVEDEVQVGKVTYDNDGHVTDFIIYGAEGDEIYSMTYKLTWSMGNLIRIEAQEDEDETKTITFAYDSSKFPNVTGQWTWNDMCGGVDELWLIYTGIFGRASKNHPVSCQIVDVYDNKTYVSNYTFNYLLNSDGTVSQAQYTVTSTNSSKTDTSSQKFTYTK